MAGQWVVAQCEVSKAAELRRRNIDIVGREIIGSGERRSDYVDSNFDDAFADDIDLFGQQVLRIATFSSLRAQRLLAFSIIALRRPEVLGGFGLKVLKVHFPHAGILGGSPSGVSQGSRVVGGRGGVGLGSRLVCCL